MLYCLTYLAYSLAVWQLCGKSNFDLLSNLSHLSQYLKIFINNIKLLLCMHLTYKSVHFMSVLQDVLVRNRLPHTALNWLRFY